MVLSVGSQPVLSGSRFEEAGNEENNTVAVYSHDCTLLTARCFPSVHR